MSLIRQATADPSIVLVLERRCQEPAYTSLVSLPNFHAVCFGIYYLRIYYTSYIVVTRADLKKFTFQKNWKAYLGKSCGSCNPHLSDSTGVYIHLYEWPFQHLWPGGMMRVHCCACA